MAPSSDRRRQGTQPCQGPTEPVRPGPALREMQGEPTGRACESADQGEQAAPEGLCGHHPHAQTDAGSPTGQVVGYHLHGHPGGVGGKASRGHVVESHTVLEVSYGVFHLGVATMVRLQLQGVSLPVGDEGVVAVVGDKGQLGAWGGFHPAHYQPHRHGVGFALEGSVGGFGHIGGSVHPVGDGTPGILGYLLYEITQVPVLSDGDGIADNLVTGGGDELFRSNWLLVRCGYLRACDHKVSTLNQLAKDFSYSDSRIL